MENGKALLSIWDKIKIVRDFDDTYISSSEKCILLTITTHIGANDFAFLSLTKLMKECCQSRGVLNENIKRLVNRGYLIKLLPSEKFRSCQFSIPFENLTGSVAVLVRLPNHPSTDSEPTWFGSRTTMVRQPNPKEHIKLLEKKVKEKPKSSFSDPEEQKPDPEPQGEQLWPIKKQIWVSKKKLKGSAHSRDELAAQYDEQLLNGQGEGHG